MGILRYKGYTGSVEFSPEDNCLFGKVLGLKGTLISYQGYSVDEITKDFKESIDYYLESCKERDIEPAKPYSGKLVVRMTSELHREVAEAAARADVPINDFINSALKRELAIKAV